MEDSKYQKHYHREQENERGEVPKEKRDGHRGSSHEGDWGAPDTEGGLWERYLDQLTKKQRNRVGKIESQERTAQVGLWGTCVEHPHSLWISIHPLAEGGLCGVWWKKLAWVDRTVCGESPCHCELGETIQRLSGWAYRTNNTRSFWEIVWTSILRAAGL